MTSYKPLINKDGCGVFGVMSRIDAPLVGSDLALTAIECARFRGSQFGAGFAGYHMTNRSSDLPYVKVFVQDQKSFEKVKSVFLNYADKGLRIEEEKRPEFKANLPFAVWRTYMSAPSDQVLFEAMMEANARAESDGQIRSWVFSSGRYATVYKGIGYPTDVAKECNLLNPVKYAQLWLAHIRQPTNSPGNPFASHPFSLFEWSIVHNGDVSSFGSNMSFLESQGVRGFVGTDSEVIAYLLDFLVRQEKLSLAEAATVLTDPYEKWWDRTSSGNAKLLKKLHIDYIGTHLDGPFAVVAGYSDGYDTFMLGLSDRSKFRPIIVGEDEARIYIASEECQIRAVSPKAKVWTPMPGRFILASSREGIIEDGRGVNRKLFFGSDISDIQEPPQELVNAPIIEATSLDYATLNNRIREVLKNGGQEVKEVKEVHVKNVKGQRYLGVGIPNDAKLVIYGTPGNCLANYNNGTQIIVYGNAEDDVADTMHDGRVIIHGNARDVVGQALQGGKIFIRGSVGNRAVIMMREYQTKRPYVIIGGTADNYLGEYMAGGVVVVLGLELIDRLDYQGQLVGDFVGTGMLGGRMYIRGQVSRDSIGLLPNKLDVVSYLEALVLDDLIDEGTFNRIVSQHHITFDVLEKELSTQFPKALARIRRLFEGKYILPHKIVYDYLDEEDRTLLEPNIKEFFEEFKLDIDLLEKVFLSKFTKITVVDRQTAAKPARAESEPLIEE